MCSQCKTEVACERLQPQTLQQERTRSMAGAERAMQENTENTQESRERQVRLYTKERAEAKKGFDEQAQRMKPVCDAAVERRERLDKMRDECQAEAEKEIRQQVMRSGEDAYVREVQRILAEHREEIKRLHAEAISLVDVSLRASREDQTRNNVDWGDPEEVSSEERQRMIFNHESERQARALAQQIEEFENCEEQYRIYRSSSDLCSLSTAGTNFMQRVERHEDRARANAVREEAMQMTVAALFTVYPRCRVCQTYLTLTLSSSKR
jgi:hypothetical protein